MRSRSNGVRHRQKHKDTHAGSSEKRFGYTGVRSELKLETLKKQFDSQPLDQMTKEPQHKE